MTARQRQIYVRLMRLSVITADVLSVDCSEGLI